MGVNVEEYQIAVEQEIRRWSCFAKALREPDREAFNDLMDTCKKIASESSCATNPIVFESMVMSILLAQQVRIQTLERQLKEASEKSGETIHG